MAEDQDRGERGMIVFLRSTLFNIAFYGATALACILCLPTLLLPKESFFVVVRCFVKSVYWLERHILRLDYEVRGLEHLPKSGAYIVAAKHQSPYETLKLHLLFDSPAVVLKQELLSIPLWGKFLSRSGPIAIDRSAGKEAMQQIVDGAKKVEAQGRPVVIFPQGTRVHPWQTAQDKPYKKGVVRMFETTAMPIVPLALNSGLFWPRSSWIKKPGTVIFQFLPAIEHDKPHDHLLQDLETLLENATHALQDEADCRESP